MISLIESNRNIEKIPRNQMCTSIIVQVFQTIATKFQIAGEAAIANQPSLPQTHS